MSAERLTAQLAIARQQHGAGVAQEIGRRDIAALAVGEHHLGFAAHGRRRHPWQIQAAGIGEHGDEAVGDLARRQPLAELHAVRLEDAVRMADQGRRVLVHPAPAGRIVGKVRGRAAEHGEVHSGVGLGQHHVPVGGVRQHVQVEREVGRAVRVDAHDRPGRVERVVNDAGAGGGPVVGPDPVLEVDDERVRPVERLLVAVGTVGRTEQQRGTKTERHGWLGGGGGYGVHLNRARRRLRDMSRTDDAEQAVAADAPAPVAQRGHLRRRKVP